MPSSIAFDNDLLKQVKLLLEICKRKGLMITTAESCTGGLIAALLTEIPGSSAIFERGFVTYSNQAKMEMLGVGSDTLENFGAVSPQTAQEMASGALNKTQRADIAISVTGIAGPDGGSAEKPVGLIYLGLGHKSGRLISHKFNFYGERSMIRMQCTKQAIELLLYEIQQKEKTGDTFA